MEATQFKNIVFFATGIGPGLAPMLHVINTFYNLKPKNSYNDVAVSDCPFGWAVSQSDTNQGLSS